jgi:hypothetical protein
MTDKKLEDLTFGELLILAGKRKLKKVSGLPPQTYSKFLNPFTHSKMNSLNRLLTHIGHTPDDTAILVDQSIKFQHLPESSIKILEEQLQIPAKRNYAPFAADYLMIFQEGNSFPNTNKAKSEKFFGWLIHILKVEAQLIASQAFFVALGFHNDRLTLTDLASVFPDEQMDGFKRAESHHLYLQDFYGKVFVDHNVVMIRAQWDKIITLCCVVFDKRQNWSSIDDGIKSLKADKLLNLHEFCRFHLDIVLNIAETQLNEENGWLRKYRDSLIHKVGEHPVGILPQKNSEETIAQIWRRIEIEHNCVREAIMAMILAFVTAKS